VPGLKALALQPDGRFTDVRFNQRRTLDQAGNALRGGEDILAIDRSRVC
jgi:hypothetical protein